MSQRRLPGRKSLQLKRWEDKCDRITKTTDPQRILQSLRGTRHLINWLVISGVIFVSPRFTMAQLRPIADDTLGNERSIVSPNEVINNLPSNRIDGGARRGPNLFHSFREFNIDNGRGVYFANPAGVTNILTRVTGGSGSQILGALGVLGNANLFLINPNGILFGPNARLDIRGSFLASTANSVVFDNGFVFSAIDPQAPPLLTVSVPVGLQYGSNPGAIQVQRALLRVPNGQTLTLAGGAVSIEGGELGALLAPGGRVELAGVAAPGEVGLAQQGQEWRLNVPDGLTRADVTLFDFAYVDVSSGGGGSIAMTARNLTIAGPGTFLIAGIASGFGTVGAQAGSININAIETVSINASEVANVVLPDSMGNAGDISITTGSLSLTNGGFLSTNTLGQGDAGKITITARDAVSFDGVNSDGLPSAASSAVTSNAIGKGGDISITTGTLSLTNGGEINTSTFGQGDAGKVTITARDAVSFDGVTGNRFSSGAFSQMRSVDRQGGDISITTGTFSLSNGAQVVSSTFGRGNAGNVKITARDTVLIDGKSSNRFTSAVISRAESEAIGKGGDINITTGAFSLLNGAQISVSTLGQGDAGKITIAARDAVSFDGVAGNRFSSGAFSQLKGVGRGGDISITTGTLSLSNGAAVSAITDGQGDAGNITLTAKDAVSFDGVGSNGLPSGAFSSVNLGASGQGRNITVDTGLFSITNGGQLSASSQGQGNAGNLDVTARQIRLDNEGKIAAQTTSGQGGNITLQVSDLLLLRRGSSISTTAGTAQAGGDGGNISFNGNFIVAIANENSDISANAFTGKGGRVDITAQGIFGTQFRSQPTPLSDITASSTFGVAGVVAINTPDIDPNRGLLQLPSDFTDASRQIADRCSANSTVARGESRFTVTGRGGLPASPDEAQTRYPDLDDLGPEVTSTQVSSTRNSASAAKTAAEIVEAQGWISDNTGNLFLVAQAPQVTPHSSVLPTINCRP